MRCGVVNFRCNAANLCKAPLCTAPASLTAQTTSDKHIMGSGGSKALPSVTAVEVAPGDPEKGIGEVRRSSLYQTGLVGTRFEGVNTLADIFNRGHSISKNEPLFVRNAPCSLRHVHNFRTISGVACRAGAPPRRMAAQMTLHG